MVPFIMQTKKTGSDEEGLELQRDNLEQTTAKASNFFNGGQVAICFTKWEGDQGAEGKSWAEIHSKGKPVPRKREFCPKLMVHF